MPGEHAAHAARGGLERRHRQPRAATPGWQRLSVLLPRREVAAETPDANHQPRCWLLQLPRLHARGRGRTRSSPSAFVKKTRPEITILTDPVPAGRRLFAERARQFARWARDRVFPPPPYVDRRYRGHFAVTRSAVEGLAKIGVAATYNP